MSASSRIISERTIGQYPVSVATSLALESATGIHPEVKWDKPPILKYDELWVNLRTLYRNLIGSLEGDGPLLVMGDVVGLELQHEMDRIESIVGSVNMDCGVRFYLSNYKDLDKKYPHARVRRDSTERQKRLHQTMMDAFQPLLAAEGGDPKDDLSRVWLFDRKLKPKTKPGRTLILTHIPYDLCSESNFTSLTLLESHTGAIKEKAQWYTKYLNGKDLPQIPFREDLLQIFGDHELFSPYPIEQRRELLEVAKKYQWSVLTTKDKILYCIEQLKNPYFKSVLRSMLVGN
jgi:hypothetical protein